MRYELMLPHQIRQAIMPTRDHTETFGICHSKHARQETRYGPRAEQELRPCSQTLAQLHIDQSMETSC